MAKRLTTALLLAAAMLGTTAQTTDAQSDREALEAAIAAAKPSKDVKKQAKALEKEGWAPAYGAPSIEEQLMRTQYYTIEMYEDRYGNAEPRYVIATATAKGKSYNSALNVARAHAQADITALISADLASLVEHNQANTEENGEARTDNQFTQTTEMAAQSVMKGAITLMNIVRKLPGDKQEVTITLAIDKAALE